MRHQTYAYYMVVRPGGLDPPHREVLPPEDSASTNSATAAKQWYKKRAKALKNQMEQVRGIEPPTPPWQGDVLPLNHTCGLKTIYKIAHY